LKTLWFFLAHLAKGKVSFCHHLVSKLDETFGQGEVTMIEIINEYNIILLIREDIFKHFNLEIKLSEIEYLHANQEDIVLYI
jgi:hypothetical protein